MQSGQHKVLDTEVHILQPLESVSMERAGLQSDSRFEEAQETSGENGGLHTAPGHETELQNSVTSVDLRMLLAAEAQEVPHVDTLVDTCL